MKPSLFITGAGGFVGKHLLAILDASKYQTIYCLTRKRENVRLPEPEQENIEVIEGDLLNSASYEQVLKEVDTVIHMAAATGENETPGIFQCQCLRHHAAAGPMQSSGGEKLPVCQFHCCIFLKNKYRYFYAQSKRAGRELTSNKAVSITPSCGRRWSWGKGHLFLKGWPGWHTYR